MCRRAYDLRYQVCRHCGRAKVNRPRGLCWSCYYTPGVREQFPCTSKYASRGFGNDSRPRPLPKPTTAVPGTAGKLAVLIARAAAEEQLWHPDDAVGLPPDAELLRTPLEAAGYDRLRGPRS